MNHSYIKTVLYIGLLWAAQCTSARQFYLMTVEPGSEFWSVYGHTALVIDDDVYGFGVFSFEQENFYSSFVQNKMTYMVGHTDIESEIYWAEQDKRRLTLMPLKLSDASKSDVIEYLRWHFQPENESYAYDYFLQNCATKIRDILNKAMNGALASNFIDSNSGGSYFSQTFPVKNQSMMTFGLAVAYGHAAYLPRTDWELMAFPMFLRERMNDPKMDKWHGPIHVEVDQNSTQVWLTFLKTHVFLILFSLVLFVGLCIEVSRAATIKIYLFIQTLVGWGLLSLWLATAHQMAAWNIQLLLFSPVAALVWRFPAVRRVLWLAVLVWFPLSIWQGSWYLWPLALINVLLLIFFGQQLSNRHSKV